MRTYVFLFFLSLIVSGSYGQYEIYQKDENLNSVLLKDSSVFVIHSVEESKEFRSYKALILNKEADELRNILLYYDQFTEVEDLNLKVKSLDGDELDSYRLKDLGDFGLISDMATEGRLKHVSLDSYTYPFLVELKYSINHMGSLHYPRWIPQAEEGMLVKYSELTIDDLSGNGVRHYEVGTGPPEKFESKPGKQYKWKVENLPPYKFDDWNYNLGDYTPYVLLAPVVFKMGEYSGGMDSWNSFGKWIARLNEGRSSLEGLDLSELDNKINESLTDKEKTAIIYDYLQSNSRYVSIQLGIGGWQPFPASYVYQNKYGDCKALSNYTVALLERYGIKAHYALINAGYYPSTIPEDFPNAHFNHAIAVVPFEDDTTYLECTSQINPFGYSGTFTSNRNALLITNGGGKLIRTKKYLATENLQSTNYKIEIENVADRNISVSMKRDFEGISIEDEWFYTRYHESDKDNVNWFIDQSEFGSIDMKNFKLVPLVEGEIPQGGFESSFDIVSGIRKAGSKLLIPGSSFFNSDLNRIKEDSTSRPIVIRYGYTQVDSLKITIPPSYFPKHQESFSLETSFGSYFKQYIPSENGLLIVRKFLLNDGRYDPGEFLAFKKFVNQVITNDNSMIVLEGGT